jgi:hypothetical protein
VNGKRRPQPHAQCPLERLRAAGIAKGVAALAAIGADPTRWDLAGWNTNMA